MALNDWVFDDHLRSLVEQSTVAPLPTQKAFFLNEYRCGWIDQSIADYLAQTFDFVLVEGDVCRIGLAFGAPLNEGLSVLASYLQQQGKLPYWRDECLDVLDDHGQVQAQIERGVMRVIGALTQAIHLVAWTSEQTVWVAQRAWHKPTNPGKWDTLAGGLVASGETYEISAVRESWEEAGVPAPMLTEMRNLGAYMVRHQLPEGYQRERSVVFDVTLSNQYQPQNQDGEAIAIEAWSVSRLMDGLSQNLFTKEAALASYLSLAHRGYINKDKAYALMQSILD